MKKIWLFKTDSIKELENFEDNYYLKMSAKERLDIMQYLRKVYFEWKGMPYADRKRLRRVVKFI